jgi:signal peptidase
LTSLAVVLAVAAWMLLCWPRGLGGRTGYVMVSGISMKPTYQSGDLVLTRARSEYRVGDIVAYHVPAGQIGAGVLVIHRITGGTARDGYILQGDNNPRPDDWHPKPGDIVGRASVHLPYAGKLLALLRDPLPLASLAAGTVLAVLLVPAERRTSSPR